MDNCGTHGTPEVKDWLNRHPRFKVHDVPTSSSWLNLIERWFGELTNKRIRRDSFLSVDDPMAAINEYLAAWNEKPRPFVWTATVESIVAKLGRCRQTLEQIQLARRPPALMRILFDQGAPVPIADWLREHTVRTTLEEKWGTLVNGELLRVAEQAEFDVLLTTDNNIAYQQNLTHGKIAIVVLRGNRWRLVQRVIRRLIAAINKAEPGSYTVVDVPTR
jgi:hypothetical protein